MLECKKETPFFNEFEDERLLLEQCLENAYETYDKWWDNKCKRLGKGKDYALSLNLADRLNKLYKERRDDCFKKYSLD